MGKEDKLLVAYAKVSVVYIIPTFVATTVCPHCSEVQFNEVPANNSVKQLMCSCSACDKDYLINIPDLSTLK